jgi:hypothetical protein
MDDVALAPETFHSDVYYVSGLRYRDDVTVVKVGFT